MRCFHPRTPPGQPADWYQRALIGAPRRKPVRAITWFPLGLVLGLLIAAAALA